LPGNGGSGDDDINFFGFLVKTFISALIDPSDIGLAYPPDPEIAISRKGNNIKESRQTEKEGRKEGRKERRKENQGRIRLITPEH